MKGYKTQETLYLIIVMDFFSFNRYHSKEGSTAISMQRGLQSVEELGTETLVMSRKRKEQSG